MSPTGPADGGADRHVVLLGLGGAVGTNAGRHLAALLQRPFADTDEQLELTAGCTIHRLAREWGEDEVRRWGGRVLADLLARDGALVIAAAGAIEIDRETRARLARSSVAVWARGSLVPGPDQRDASAGPCRSRLEGEPSTRYEDVADHVVDLAPFLPLDDPGRAVAHHILHVLSAGGLRGTVRVPDRGPEGDDDQLIGQGEPDLARLYEQVADVAVDVEPFHDLDDPERAMARHILRLLARADEKT